MEVGFLLSILVLLLIACIVVWAARKLMAAWEVGEPFATTVYVILVVLFAVVLLTRVLPGAVRM
jgi:hypothetical protein